MRKVHIIAFTLLTAGCMMGGCGDRVSNSRQPVQAEGLEAVSASLLLAVQESEDANEQSMIIEAEANGDETMVEKIVVRTADIYNRPSRDAAKLGSVSRGESILTLGLLDEEDWYKVNYNGRVAYVQADTLQNPENRQASDDRTNSTSVPESAEMADPELTQGETTDPKPAPGETTGSEPMHVETPNSEPAQGETADPEPTPAETTSSEPTQGEATDPEPTQGETTDFEPTPGETTDPEPTPAETTDPEPTPAETPDSEPAPGETTDPEPAPAETTDPEPTQDEVLQQPTEP